MLHTDVGPPLREQAAGFTSPLTRMLPVGNGLTTPALEAAPDITLRVRELRQNYVTVEQIPEADSQ
jgi:hypothetical protein